MKDIPPLIKRLVLYGPRPLLFRVGGPQGLPQYSVPLLPITPHHPLALLPIPTLFGFLQSRQVLLNISKVGILPLWQLCPLGHRLSFPPPVWGPHPSRLFSEDLRSLPLPEPGDKHDPMLPPGSRYKRSWDWSSWKKWMRRCWIRPHWERKKEINRMLLLRSQEASNKDVDWLHCDNMFHTTGAIYAIYHFTSGR